MPDTKKINIKMLEKQSFENQILIEFKKITNGILSKIDKHNKLLSYLVLFQNQITLPFPPFFKNQT